MSIALQKKTALQQYHAGVSLYEEQRYREALVELEHAEEGFRTMDARGHPFSHALSNGVTGLANTLAYAGLCHQRLENYREAVRCYETSFINSRFEKSRPFTAFTSIVGKNLRECYEQLRDRMPPDAFPLLLRSPEDIDTTRRFPFSLPDDAVILARLYELAPERYAAYRDFYHDAQGKDQNLRKYEKRPDMADMRTRSIVVWSVLIIIWTLYGFIAIDALLQGK